MPDDEQKYLELLIHNMQVQLNNSASKDMVLELSKQVNDLKQMMIVRLNEISREQIPELAMSQRNMSRKLSEQSQESMRKIIITQAAVLLSATTIIVSVMINYFFRFFR